MKAKWMAIAYSSNKSRDYREDKKAFEKAYPYISKVIRFLKKKDYKQFSITLQRIESYMIIDLIVPELIKAGITPLTIHDCFIVAQNEQKETHQIMLRVLKQELGFEPKIDDDLLTDITKIKPPRKVKKVTVKPSNQLTIAADLSVEVAQEGAAKEPEISLNEVMISFINNDQNYFMREINNSISLFNKLSAVNDFKILTEIFKEEEISNLSYSFLDYYDKFIELAA